MDKLKNPLIVLLAALLLASCAAPQKTGPEQMQDLKFRKCECEGNIALAVGRMYFTNGRKKEAVLKNANIQRSQIAKDFLNEISDRATAGELRHYADFATDKLYGCAQREGLNIGKPRELARICYARVDIPFFLVVFKSQGMDKKQAIEKTSTLFHQRTIYPEKLITAVADVVYTQASEQENQKLMGFVFWSCLHNPQSTGAR